MLHLQLTQELASSQLWHHLQVLLNFCHDIGKGIWASSVGAGPGGGHVPVLPARPRRFLLLL